MKSSSRILPLLLGPALAAATFAAQAAVFVTFNQPDKYSDTGTVHRESDAVLRDIERHLQSLGKAHLPADRVVRIEVLDIDLAGEDRPRWASGTEIRVLRGLADWPRIRLRYLVETSGAGDEWREEVLSDMNYLTRPISKPDSFAYEKRMLGEWFRSRFVAP